MLQLEGVIRYYIVNSSQYCKKENIVFSLDWLGKVHVNGTIAMQLGHAVQVDLVRSNALTLPSCTIYIYIYICNPCSMNKIHLKVFHSNPFLNMASEPYLA